MSSIICRTIAVVVCLAVAGVRDVSWAQTSASDPLAPLALRNDSPVAKLASTAQTGYLESNEGIEQIEELIASGKISEVQPIEVGKIFVVVDSLDRQGGRIAIMGETAGIDFRLRASELRRRVMEIIRLFKESPAGLGKFADTTPVARVAQKRARDLAKCRAFAAQGRWDKADVLFEEILSELSVVRVWLGDGGVSDEYNRFSQEWVKAVTELASREASAQLERIVDNSQPKFDRFAKQLSDATAAVGTDGKVKGSGSETELSGPDWLLQFLEKWKELHLRVLQAYGDRLAWHFTTPGPATAARESLQRDTRASFDATIAALGEFVAADLQRPDLTESEARQLYADYVMALGRIGVWTGAERIESVIGPTIASAVSRFPTLSRDAGTYMDACHDWLRWQARVAKAYADHVSEAGGYTPLPAALTAVQGQLQTGPMLAGSDTIAHALLLKQSAPTVAEYVGKPMIGQRVLVSDLMETGIGSGLLNSLPLAGTIGRVPQGVETGDLMAAMQQGLYVGQGAPVLSIRAAVALESVANAQFENIGGDVTEFRVTSRTSEYSNADSDDWGKFRVEPINVVEGNQTTIESSVWAECDVRPSWGHHRYFFVNWD